MSVFGSWECWDLYENIVVPVVGPQTVGRASNIWLLSDSLISCLWMHLPPWGLIQPSAQRTVASKWYPTQNGDLNTRHATKNGHQMFGTFFMIARCHGVVHFYTSRWTLWRKLTYYVYFLPCHTLFHFTMTVHFTILSSKYFLLQV